MSVTGPRIWQRPTIPTDVIDRAAAEVVAILTKAHHRMNTLGYPSVTRPTDNRESAA